MLSTEINVIQRGVPSEWLVSALVERGIPLTEICVQLKLSEKLLQNRNYVLSANSYNDLFEWGATTLNDETLGIHIAERTSPAQFGIFGYIVSNTETLAHWAKWIERYHCLFSPEFNIYFEMEGDLCKCCYMDAQLKKKSMRQDISFSLASLIKAIRLYVGLDWTPHYCNFSFSSIMASTEYNRYFGENINFNQSDNSFYFDAELLKTKITSADPSLLKILEQQANQLLDQLSAVRGIEQHVRLLITTHIGDESLSTESIAKYLHMSVRSLHRKLKEHNISFRDLREDIVMQTAKRALLKTNASITDISAKLGYSESSAFIRLFTRLEGISPLQFRRQYKKTKTYLSQADS